MENQRRKHSAEFKARVALAAVRGVKTVSEIAAQYQVHPVMVSNWKKELLSNLPGIFVGDKSKKKKEKNDKSQDPSRLERKIGQLTMEVEWLEKKCEQLGIPVNEKRCSTGIAN
jgi:putative transposase